MRPRLRACIVTRLSDGAPGTKRMYVRVVDWKAEPAARPGDDVDSLIRREGIDAFKRLVANAKPYGDWMIDQAEHDFPDADIYERSKLVHRLVSVAKNERDPVIRAHYRTRIAALAGITLEDVSKLMGEPRSAIKHRNTGGWV